jgi:hypothetical protein
MTWWMHSFADGFSHMFAGWEAPFMDISWLGKPERRGSRAHATKGVTAA